MIDFGYFLSLNEKFKRDKGTYKSMELNINRLLNQLSQFEVQLSEKEKNRLIQFYKAKEYNSLHDLIFQIVIENGKNFSNEERFAWTSWLSDKINHDKLSETHKNDEDIIKYCNLIILILFTQYMPNNTYEF